MSLMENEVSNCEMSWGMISARRWARFESVIRRRTFYGGVLVWITASVCRFSNIPGSER